MANWKETLDLSSFYRDESIEIVEKSKMVAQKLHRIIGKSKNFDEYDLSDLENIAEEFEMCIGGEDDLESFDYNMEQLYDWADACKL